MIEKQVNHSIAFLDICISGIDNQNLTLQTYRKSTFTGLLLNFKSFASFSYKISLIKGGLSAQMTWQFLNALELFSLKKANYPIFVFV